MDRNTGIVDQHIKTAAILDGNINHLLPIVLACRIVWQQTEASSAVLAFQIANDRSGFVGSYVRTNHGTRPLAQKGVADRYADISDAASACNDCDVVL